MRVLRALLARLVSRRADVDAGPTTAAPGPDALAQVYARAGHLYIEASDRTRWAEAGFWVASGEVTILGDDVADAELGAAVLAALARSRIEVPVPSRDAKLEAGLFRAMGVRSRRAGMTGTRSCLVSRETERARVRVEPLRNGGTRGEGRGYRGLEAPADGAETGGVTELSSREATADGVATAVRRALQRATVEA